MVSVRCIECRTIGPWGRTGRCTTHRLQHQRTNDRTPARRTMKAKYDANHRRLRKIWEPLVQTGGVNCSRCNKPITGNFDLGHRPGLPSHPEHPHCNRSAH